MAASTPRLRSEGDEPRPMVELRWDERARVRAAAGSSVASALLQAGVVATSRSLKYRRPRGPYCLRGDCGTCLVRIDGRPNLRACLIPARDGQRVDAQNRVGPRGIDPTALVDAFMGPVMDHHHFVLRPRFANEVMKDVARQLAGLGTLPDPDGLDQASHEHHDADVVVIGRGPAGQAAIEVLEAASRRVLAFDRASDGLGVFGLYPEEGWVVAATDGRAGPARLVTVRPRHVVLATGAYDPMIPIAGNDLPGVVSARGLEGLLRRQRLSLAVPVVVVGSGPRARDLADAWGAPWLDEGVVASFEGRGAVERVQTRSGDAYACGLVALAPTPAPASDLARQAGAPVRWNGAGFAVQRDPRGRCATDLPWEVWACGDVAGFVGPAAAAEDGRRVAENLVADDEGRR